MLIHSIHLMESRSRAFCLCSDHASAVGYKRQSGARGEGGSGNTRGGVVVLVNGGSYTRPNPLCFDSFCRTGSTRKEQSKALVRLVISMVV